MQGLVHYLKELLIDYDCVTIPGLGGFIMHSHRAKINQGKNVIYPPARIPSFNLLLNHDDGLLISSLSRQEQLTYAQASEKVAHFVNALRKQLEKDGKYRLDGIGEFIYTPEKIILFRQEEQVNFATASFGLAPLRLFKPTGIARQNRLTVKSEDRKPRTLSTKKPASVRWTLSLTLPVVLILLYGIISPASFQQAYTSTSNLASYLFHAAIKDVPPPLDETPLREPPKEDISPEFNPDPAPATELHSEALPAVEKESLPAAIASPKYYIIGGCFESEENTSKFLAELIQKGYHAEKAGTNKRGHWRISYGSFTDKSAALNFLSAIREKENQAAWLLKY